MVFSLFFLVKAKDLLENTVKIGIFNRISDSTSRERGKLPHAMRILKTATNGIQGQFLTFKTSHEVNHLYTAIDTK